MKTPKLSLMRPTRVGSQLALKSFRGSKEHFKTVGSSLQLHGLRSSAMIVQLSRTGQEQMH
jgi:hypothetical protein